MQRIILGFIAVLFFLSTIGAVAAIYLASKNEDPNAAAQQAALEQLQGQQDCGQALPTALEPRAEPAAFTLNETVTSLQSTDLKTGEGDEVQAGDCITVFYHGTIARTGEKFDGNYAAGQPVEFSLSGVIPGWQEGIPGMKPGGVRRLVIPAEMAYGSTGSCSVPDPADQAKCAEYAIPPNTDLVFEVELVSIK